jgi:hypothetical protein
MKGGGCNMKKKLLAVLSLVMVLAMESVTVFATESTGAPSPNSGNVLYGNAGDDTISGDVAAATLDNLSVEELADTVEVTIDEATGTVTSDTGLVFVKDADKGLQLTQTATSSINLANVVIKLDKELGHSTKEFTQAETKASVAIAQYATSLANNVGANVEVSYAVNVEGSVDASGKPDKQVEFSVQGKSIVNGNVTIIHATDDGKTENLGAEVLADGKIRSKKIPSSYSPFVLLVFDSPVPGLTTDIDYSTQSTTLTNGESTTVSGDVSPKTADAYPYDIAVAVLAVAAIAVCGKKLAK